MISIYHFMILNIGETWWEEVKFVVFEPVKGHFATNTIDCPWANDNALFAAKNADKQTKVRAKWPCSRYSKAD